MPPYLNTEPTPYRPGSAEAIERLQVALRHLRAAKLALTDLAYAPACEAYDTLEEADPMDYVEDAIARVAGDIDALGGKPDMDSHYSAREQAKAFEMALRCVSLVPGVDRVRDKFRAALDMARRMA